MLINLKPSNPLKKLGKKSPQQVISTYEKQQVLGKGTYGIVYKSQHKVNQNFYAIKKIEKVIIQEEGISRFFHREIAILHALDHPNIIKLHNYNLTESDKYGFLIFQYMETDLAKQIIRGNSEENAVIGKKVVRNQRFKDNIRNLLKQLLTGIEYCHRKNIIHRDLKPSNVLVDKQLTIAKIADFGVAKTHNCFGGCHTPKTGTKYYRAPETMFENRAYGPEIDIWSVALVIAECILGQPVLQYNSKTQPNEIFLLMDLLQITDFRLNSQNQISFQEFLLFWQKKQSHFRLQQKIPELKILGESGVQLLNKMLEIDPSKRISASEALLSPYFTQKQTYIDRHEENQIMCSLFQPL